MVRLPRPGTAADPPSRSISSGRGGPTELQAAGCQTTRTVRPALRWAAGSSCTACSASSPALLPGQDTRPSNSGKIAVTTRRRPRRPAGSRPERGLAKEHLQRRQRLCGGRVRAAQRLRDRRLRGDRLRGRSGRRPRLQGPARPRADLHPTEWQAFLDGVRDGQFDLPRCGVEKQEHSGSGTAASPASGPAAPPDPSPTYRTLVRQARPE
jgi:hypothetical protein